MEDYEDEIIGCYKYLERLGNTLENYDEICSHYDYDEDIFYGII